MFFMVIRGLKILVDTRMPALSSARGVTKALLNASVHVSVNFFFLIFMSEFSSVHAYLQFVLYVTYCVRSVLLRHRVCPVFWNERYVTSHVSLCLRY
jgi:hypothetical protein